jgi:hypothetical protein
MAEFSIDLGPLGDAFGEILDRADANARTAMSGGMQGIVDRARALAPAGSSGGLRNGIRNGGVVGSVTRGGLTGEVIADAAYAEAQESGSGLYGPKRAKYPILPRFKKALRFPMQGAIGSGSGFVFSRGVMHPGVKPVRFLERAVEAGLDDLEAEVAAAIELALIKR